MTRVPRAEETSGIIPYEQRLDADFEYALLEGSMHFDETNSVHKALRRIAQRLDELNIPYAVAGGMALFFHGYRRFTEDVDILVTREGKNRAQEALTGLGYLPPFSGIKNLRDTEAGVRIEFLIAGDYPGDGKPKPIAFPKPQDVAAEINGIQFLRLPTLIELKLASGITNPRRAKDLVDVQELIATLGLTEDFAEQLHPFVQSKYQELWRIVRDNPE